MKYKSGDIVIKKTGGNKMTVVQEYKKNDLEYHYKCYWFIESKLYEEVFSENEIVDLIEYKRFLKIEERDDKINQILK